MVLFSALNSISDPVLYYLASSVVVINALVILLLIQIISIRIYGVYQHRAESIGREIWRPILAEMMQTYPDDIPRLQRKHRHVFLHEWNKFYFYCVVKPPHACKNYHASRDWTWSPENILITAICEKNYWASSPWDTCRIFRSGTT